LIIAAARVVGRTWAETYKKFGPASPFGGYKECGFGREGGEQGLLSYLDIGWSLHAVINTAESTEIAEVLRRFPSSLRPLRPRRFPSSLFP